MFRSKPQKTPNSTNKQMLDCHAVFTEIQTHQSWFLTQTSNTSIYFSAEVQEVSSASPEGFQTFEHHQKIPHKSKGSGWLWDINNREIYPIIISGKLNLMDLWRRNSAWFDGIETLWDQRKLTGLERDRINRVQPMNSSVVLSDSRYG